MMMKMLTYSSLFSYPCDKHSEDEILPYTHYQSDLSAMYFITCNCTLGEKFVLTYFNNFWILWISVRASIFFFFQILKTLTILRLHCTRSRAQTKTDSNIASMCYMQWCYIKLQRCATGKVRKKKKRIYQKFLLGVWPWISKTMNSKYF